MDVPDLDFKTGSAIAPCSYAETFCSVILSAHTYESCVCAADG